MGIWSLDAETAALLFLLLAPALAVPWLHRLYRDHGRMAGIPALTMVAEVAYVCGVLAVTLFPLPDSRSDDRFCNIWAGKGWRLQPFTTFRRVFDEALETGVAVLASGQFLQLLLNVVMIVPLGFFVAFRFRRPLWVAVAAGLGTSLMIEVTQGTGVWGLFECAYRVAEFDDLVTNTTGAVVGWLLGRLAARHLSYPAPDIGDDLDAPTLGRRLLANAADVTIWVVIDVIAQVGLLAPVVVLGSRRTVSEPWFSTLAVVLGVVIPAVVLFVVVPLMRADGATPGQQTVLLALAPHSAGGHHRAVLTRATVRWLPLTVAAAVGGEAWLLAVVLFLAEAGASWTDPRRRSLAARLARSSTVTSATAARRRSTLTG